MASGICGSYLLLPLLHYLSGRAEYRYITTASNFFAFRFTLQLLIFVVAAAFAIGVSVFRLRLPARGESHLHQ